MHTLNVKEVKSFLCSTSEYSWANIIYFCMSTFLQRVDMDIMEGVECVRLQKAWSIITEDIIVNNHC